jgi:hypothetical protein
MGGHPSFSAGKPEGLIGLHFLRFIRELKARMRKSAGED